MRRHLFLLIEVGTHCLLKEITLISYLTTVIHLDAKCNYDNIGPKRSDAFVVGFAREDEIAWVR
jgi:hypothetical protein